MPAPNKAYSINFEHVPVDKALRTFEAYTGTFEQSSRTNQKPRLIKNFDLKKAFWEHGL